MKKKIIGTVAIVAIAAMAAFNINLNTENNVLSALTLDNVEALANGESGVQCRVNTNDWDSPCAYWYSGGHCPCGW